MHNKNKHRGSIMKSSKSPYEIRSDLLRLAFDILTQKSIVEMNNSEENKKSTQSSFSTEDVIAAAKKLNSFISEN